MSNVVQLKSKCDKKVFAKEDLLSHKRASELVGSVREKWNTASPDEKLDLLNAYDDGLNILVDLSVKKGCCNCQERYLLCALRSFSVIKNSAKTFPTLAMLSASYAHKSYEKLNKLYKTHKKFLELEKLKNEYFDAKKNLVILN